MVILIRFLIFYSFVRKHISNKMTYIPRDGMCLWWIVLALMRFRGKEGVENPDDVRAVVSAWLWENEWVLRHVASTLQLEEQMTPDVISGHFMDDHNGVWIHIAALYCYLELNAYLLWPQDRDIPGGIKSACIDKLPRGKKPYGYSRGMVANLSFDGSHWDLEKPEEDGLTEEVIEFLQNARMLYEAEMAAQEDADFQLAQELADEWK